MTVSEAAPSIDVRSETVRVPSKITRMKTLTPTTLFVAALVALTLTTSSSTLAQSEAGEERVARSMRERGVEAARAGDWTSAQELFQRSHDLDPRVLTLYNLAAAEMRVEMLVEADEHFRLFIRATSDGSHAEFNREANRFRSELASRIGTLRLRILNLSGEDTVQLDGNELSAAVLDIDFPVNPGQHRIAVVREGNVVADRELVWADGARETVELTVPALAEATTTTTTVPSPEETANTVVTSSEVPEEPVASNPSRGRNIAIGVVVGVVVIAGLVVGGVLLFGEDTRDPFEGDFALRF